MTRWIDCRNYLPPKNMTVLVYIRDKVEYFEDRICSASCNYDIDTDSDGHNSINPFSREWSIIEVNQKWEPKKSQALQWEDETELLDITHWTLIPDKGSSNWIDIDKFSPPEFLDHLVYMRDKCEDRNDFIIGGSYHLLKNIKKIDRSKLRYEPVYWGLMPQVPRLVDDTFAC